MGGPVVAPDRTATGPGAIRAWWRRPAAAVAAFAVVVAALAAGGILLGVAIGHYDDVVDRHRRAERQVEQRDELGAAAIDAARHEVIELLTVSAKTSSQDVTALLSGAAARFRDQLRQEAQSLKQALAPGTVSSTGSVAAAGLVSLTGRGAVVAVAARSMVRSSASPNGEPRNYRLTVSLERIGKRWLVSDLKFVV